jgi:hypothetical protein
MKKRLLFLVLQLVLVIAPLYAQTKVTLSGHVRDGTSGEALVNATLIVKENGAGAVTNVYGFYSLTLPEGNYTLEFSYLGYLRTSRTIELHSSTTVDVELQPEAGQLNEVVITAEENQIATVKSVEMSTAKLDIKTIAKMPAFLGEVDIVKSLQMIPGVSTVGEGSSGFNVRGGSVGQNLLLLDEAPVYNSSHMLGFFSAFNPDAVKDVKLFKGGIPARYGGRLSSLLDIRMKDGNSKEFTTSGGVGTVFTRLALEGPIVKDKGSFILAGRRSYADLFAGPFLNGASLNFYDLTAKANYSINQRNRIYLSGYFGRDNFGFSGDQGLNWGSATTTIRWNHLFNDRLFANFSGIYSRYDYELELGDDARDRFKWDSQVTNLIFKPEFSYFIDADNEIAFGGEVIFYDFMPARTTGVSGGESFRNTVADKNAREAALYVSHNVKLSSALAVEYGVRLSTFRYVGEGAAYTFNDTIPGRRRTVIAEESYDKGEKIAGYTNPEPRISLKYELSDRASIKASYNRTAQYVHLISNTVASNPLDIWTPSTNNIEPQIGDQYALGYFGSMKKNTWEFSVEAYYRDLANQIDYINGADLLINNYIEGDLLSGDGRAYGVEFFVQKKTGRLNGWLSYTLSRSELKIDGINNGDWYAAVYDQTNNLKVALFYQLSQRWSVSSNFVYTTGTPTTAPTSKYYAQGIAIPYNPDNSRNNYRLEDYHRLDVAFRLDGKLINKNGKQRKNTDYWIFSLYNVYARRNAFSVDFRQRDDRFSQGDIVRTEAIRTSILGSIVPSVSYNFKF